MKRTLTTMMILVLAAAIALPGAAAATSATGSTAVTGHVATRAYVTATDDGILVKANTGWRVEVQSADGYSSYTGGRTAGTSIPLPEGTVAYWIVTE